MSKTNKSEKEPRADSPEENEKIEIMNEIVRPSNEMVVLDESIVNSTDKAYLIQDNDILGFDDANKVQLLKMSSSIGKLYVEGESSYRGTCWVTPKKFVATCLHVVREDMRFGHVKGKVNFNGIKNSNLPDELFEVLNQQYAKKDLSILKLRRRFPTTMPLQITNDEVREGQEIFIIGFPSKNEFKSPNSEVVFQDFYNYKVLTKGKVLKVVNQYDFTHDCATLEGMSGAPIIDVNTLEIIGVHAQGEHYKQNHGIAAGLVRKLLTL